MFFFAFAWLSRKEQQRVFLFFIQRLSARYIASVRQLETLHYHLAETDQRSWHHLFLFFFSGIVKSTHSLSFSLSLQHRHHHRHRHHRRHHHHRHYCVITCHRENSDPNVCDVDVQENGFASSPS